MNKSVFFERLINRSTLSLIVLVLCLDLIATICYVLFLNDVLDSRFFRIGRDRGLFELIEYLKFGIIIVILRAAWRESNAAIMQAWSILFIVMLVDNALGLHEAFGGLLASYVTLPDIGLARPKDLGEIIMLGAMEGVALLFVIYRYLESEPAMKKFSHGLIVTVVLLGAGSITFDALHFSTIEEPFEILGVTLLLAYVHYHSHSFELATQSN